MAVWLVPSNAVQVAGITLLFMLQDAPEPVPEIWQVYVAVTVACDAMQAAIWLVVEVGVQVGGEALLFMLQDAPEGFGPVLLIWHVN